MRKQEGGGVIKKLCFVLERPILPSFSLICIISSCKPTLEQFVVYNGQLRRQGIELENSPRSIY